ncbi:MAG: Holliday junction resolvase RuvX [Lachnospiraceae bacterium]|nr:Holliday junction resolvase RuvX [Lachnospiraceae bacterium]
MRIIGLDYGDKTVGVALSDELYMTAQPLKTIFRDRTNKLRRTYAEIERIIKEYKVEKVVIGLPKKMNNEEGEMCEKVRAFGADVARRTGLPVEYVDERLTTHSADEVLEEGNVKKERRKHYIDKIAASLILKTYLDSLETAKTAEGTESDEG